MTTSEPTSEIMPEKEYNLEQKAANELRDNAYSTEEKDIATAALRKAFPNLRPGVARFNDGDKVMWKVK